MMQTCRAWPRLSATNSTHNLEARRRPLVHHLERKCCWHRHQVHTRHQLPQIARPTHARHRLLCLNSGATRHSFQAPLLPVAPAAPRRSYFSDKIKRLHSTDGSRLSCQHLPQQHAKRVAVGGRAQDAALQHLRRLVRQRAALPRLHDDTRDSHLARAPEVCNLPASRAVGN